MTRRGHGQPARRGARRKWERCEAPRTRGRRKCLVADATLRLARPFPGPRGLALQGGVGRGCVALSALRAPPLPRAGGVLSTSRSRGDVPRGRLDTQRPRPGCRGLSQGRFLSRTRSASRLVGCHWTVFGRGGPAAIGFDSGLKPAPRRRLTAPRWPRAELAR